MPIYWNITQRMARRSRLLLPQMNQMHLLDASLNNGY